MNRSSAAPTPVSLRDVWPLEAQHFTPWLTANLHHLADALGISLQALPSKRVGAHRIADLLARDEDNGSLVLIENQLEAADDAHMGQILAYLAGSGANSLIWIARDFDARWLDVMKWLNAATRSQFCFFAVRIEVVRRGARDLVPRFQVLHAPQQWRAPPTPIRGATSRLGFAASFWAAHAQWRPNEAATSFQVGSRCRWRATPLKGVVVGLNVAPDAAEVFLRGRHGVTRAAAIKALSPFAAQIERELGVPFSEETCPVLALTRLNVDMTDGENWPQVSKWLAEQAQRYCALLAPLAEKDCIADSRDS